MMWSRQSKLATPERRAPDKDEGENVQSIAPPALCGFFDGLHMVAASGRMALEESDLTPSSKALLFMSLTISLLIQLMGCMPPTRLAHAQMQEVEIREQGPTYEVRALDDNGTEVDRYEQARAYVDDNGTIYRCINPHIAFVEDTFTQDDNPLSLETTKRCALAQKWCSEHFDSGQKDVATQVFIWKILTADGYFDDLDVNAVDWAVVGIAIATSFDAFQSWYAENQHLYIGTGVHWVGDQNMQDVMTFSVTECDGGLQLRKTSAQPAMTEGNDAYTLKGARYGIWRDETCSISATDEELVTDESGASNVVTLAPGTYYVRESAAPEGYLLDASVHTITVGTEGLNTLDVTDNPIYQDVDVWARKTAEGISIDAHEAMPLAGCKVKVCYYATYFENNVVPSDAKPTQTWFLESDTEGRITVPETSRDTSFVVDGKVVCPLGTVTIQEVAAPAGYSLEGQTNNSDSSYKAPVHVVEVRGGGTFDAPTIIDSSLRAGIVIHKKDAQTGKVAQGDATLSGITFQVINKGDSPITIDGTSYGTGEVVATLTTDEEGTARSQESQFPLGAYAIREAQPNQSYLRNDEEITVTIKDSDAGTIVDAGTIEDKVVRGGFRIQKVSRETLQGTPQGAAMLAGTKLELALVSERPVVVEGASVAPASFIRILELDEKGAYESTADMLPYGTYRVREIAEPIGYLINEQWSATFEIREDGKIVDVSTTQAPLDDQVMRGGLTFTKVEKASGKPLAGIPFKITSKTTGESHIMVTNANGILDTELVPHTTSTNANDAALLSDGSIDESELDPNVGVWFSGAIGVTTEPSNASGALPYDTYCLEELYVTANADKIPIAPFDVTVRKNEEHVNLGVVTNETIVPSEITTRLSLEASVPEESYTFVDTVSYQNLKPGQSYVLVGTLLRKDDATRQGSSATFDTTKALVTSSHAFTPAASAGTEEVILEYRGDLSGETVVAYEALTTGDGDIVCFHNDPLDVEQTAHIPSIDTYLADKDGNKEIASHNGYSFVDTVLCENLEPLQWYTLEGTLIYQDTKEFVKDRYGEALTGRTVFQATSEDEVVDVLFSVYDAKLVEGRAIVAFEGLYLDEVCIAIHMDINDPDQTVSMPIIVSELTDGSGNHIIPNTGKVTLTDSVTYAGLTPGITYEIFGTLVDKKTGNAVRTAQNVNATSHVSFRAEGTSGTRTVTFEIDTSTLQGTELVAFESIVCDGREIACHEDINDRLQTVSIPSLQTELTASSGGHQTAAAKQVTLNDTVSYAGLDTSKTYTVVGTLMDASTGKQITDTNGNPITSTQQIAAGSSSGKISVPFTFDASELGGKSVVAFETIREGTGTTGKEIATHNDLKNELQTVAITAANEPTDKLSPMATTPASTTPLTGSDASTPSTPATTTQTGTGTSPTQAYAGTGTVAGTQTTAGSVLPHTYDGTRAPGAFLCSGLALVVMSVASRLHLDHLEQSHRESSTTRTHRRRTSKSAATRSHTS